MSEIKQDYWVSSEEFTQDESFVKASGNEFFDLPILNNIASEEENASTQGHNRRDFLKYLGFSIGAATIAAGCESPIRKAIPYVTKPDSIVPGIANYYSSTFIKGNDVLPIVVKTREGRPIKIEGNSLSKFSQGGTSARAQASVLDLYDIGRYRFAGQNKGKDYKKISWSDLDQQIGEKLTPAARIRLVSNSITSPSMMAAIAQFTAAYPGTKHVTYDPFSSSAIIIANERSFGKRVFPGYEFGNASIVVNFGADFLGTWVSPVEYSAAWTKTRKLKDFNKPDMSRLIQYESNMSYTGSNADNRMLIRPSEQGTAIVKLYNAVAALAGASTISSSGSLKNAKAEKSFSSVAQDLWANKNKGQSSLVISDSNNISEQIIINKINDLLGNYGKTIDLNNYSNQRKGVDSDMLDLIKDMNSNVVDVVIIMGDANPAFDLPDSSDFASGLKKVGLSVSLSTNPNETSVLCKYVAPANHFLESWGDAQPRKNFYYVMQPTIAPLFATRQAEITLLKWAKFGVTDYDAYIQNTWKGSLFSLQNEFSSFQSFWDNTLHNGLIELNAEAGGASVSIDVNSIAAGVTKPATGVEVKYYEPMGVGCGAYANNPWLQELPDPITRAVWTSVVHIPLKWDGDSRFDYYKDLNKDGLYVDFKSGKVNVENMPIVRQFGQMSDTLAIPLGYGRKEGNASAKNVGNYVMNTLSRDSDGNVRYWNDKVEITPTGGEDAHYASVQHHHTLGVTGKDKSNQTINVDEKALMTLGSGYQGSLTGRSILKSADMSNFAEKVKELKEFRAEASHLNNETMYPGHDDLYKQGHHWGLSVDLNSCTGCGACQVACVAENNVPIVGKNEVHRHHEMTWLRIDRYYYGDVESPNVFYQPMMCQHCDNAPCENVCPVNATNHSAEGLNQMAYNRCVGTRYCANNCPYKVRRFNWSDFTTADLFGKNEKNVMPDGETLFYEDNLTRMVLNPDVTVRSRGVIEKCSMCIQRIQEGKLRAKIESRPLKETDITTACAAACPTGGIIFGDQNTKDGILNTEWSNPTTYFALEEINVRSKVGYKMRLTNKNADLA